MRIKWIIIFLLLLSSIMVAKTGKELGLEIGQAAAYPNPVDFNKGDLIHFTVYFKKGNVVEKKVYVFDFSGKRIWKKRIKDLNLIPAAFKWNGAKKDGEIIKKGIYFFCIEYKYDTGRIEKTKIGKFLVK